MAPGTPKTSESTRYALKARQLQDLFDLLAAQGYRLAGPVIRDGTVVYEEIKDVADLPYGYSDVQAPGAYRLKRANPARCFDCHPGPHTWKKFLFAPETELFTAVRSASGFKVSVPQNRLVKTALIGVRPCELKALNIIKRVFANSRAGADSPSSFAHLFTVAVNCTAPGGNCFCVSMNAGPAATHGFDLCLTEIDPADEPLFVVETGSARGLAVINDLSCRPARRAERTASRQMLDKCAAAMPKTMETRNLQQILYAAALSPIWADTAEKCLACGNCTLVCPTCFCFNVTDHTDISGTTALRKLAWDSCFNRAFSHIHGGVVRTSILSRYRQWLTHKLAGWHDQFYTSGCVGCGRCLTWCPVGIDITEVVQEIRRQVGLADRSVKESCNVGD